MKKLIAVAGVLFAAPLYAQTIDIITAQTPDASFVGRISGAAVFIYGIALGAILTAAVVYLSAVLSCEKIRKSLTVSFVVFAVSVRLCMAILLTGETASIVALSAAGAIFVLSVINALLLMRDNKRQSRSDPVETAVSITLVAAPVLDGVVLLAGGKLPGWFSGAGYFIYAVLEAVSVIREVASEYHAVKQRYETYIEKFSEAEREISRAREEVDEFVTTDKLTGLFNRKELYRKMKFEKERLKRYHRSQEISLSVVFLELENFNYYENTYGKQVADLVLVGFSDVVKKISRASDVPCRFEGGEFVVMLVETDTGGAKIFAERLLKEIEARKWFEDDISDHLGAKIVIPMQSRIGCSAGIASYYFDLTSNASDLDIDAAIEKSERAMHSAKAEGKNRVSVWEGF